METFKNLTFGKDKTAIIKGFAILFMIILHCGCPEWYLIELPAFAKHHNLQNIIGVFKICVGIFTFMVGYGYAYSKNKDLRYSFLHIKRLLIPLWMILLIALPVIISRGDFTLKTLLLNLLGVNSVYNFFSWFVAFYIYAMIIMPLVSRIIDKRLYVGTTLFICIAYVLEVAIHQFIPNYTENDWLQRLFDCFSMTPIMLIGYLYARKKIFTSIRIPDKWYMLPVAMLLIALIFVARYCKGYILGFNLDFIYAPIFILSILIIFSMYNLHYVSCIMQLLGKYSVYMWFIHALFFTGATRDVFQPVILISDNLFIITTWTIIVTFVLSVVMSRIVEFVQQRLTSLFTK